MSPVRRRVNSAADGEFALVIGYPRYFKTVLWTVLGALIITGLLLIPGALELRWEMDAPLQLPRGTRIGVAALHALGAFLMLAVLGSLFTLHMRIGWRHGENIRSGLTTVGSILALVLSGLGIYYLADEALSRWTSALHIALGVAAAAATALHYVLGRRIRAARLARRHITLAADAPKIAEHSRVPGAHEHVRPAARRRA